jgi:hypothetical protein
MIEIDLPDGSIAEFPDGTPDNVIERALQEAYPSQQPAQTMGTGEDVGRSLASGARWGIEGIPGVFGDVGQLGENVGSWISGKLGASPEQIEKAKNLRDESFSLMPDLPTTQQIHDVTTPVVGESHTPQTTAGEYGFTGGNFIASLAAPGGPVRKLAGWALPSLASETAGQVTEGTAAEPYARFAGALAGGAASARGGRPKAAPAPTSAELSTEANAIFNQVKQSGVTASPQALNKLYNEVGTKLKDFGFHPKLQPDTATVVTELIKSRGMPLSLPEFHNLRKLATGAARSAQKSDDRAAAGRIVEAIDDILDDANNFSAGSDQARNLLREGIATSKRKIKTEMIEDVVERAKNQATGFENGLVVQFRALANNKKKMRSFSKQEQDMIRGIVRRPSLHGMLRAVGMLSPNSTFGGITTGMGLASGVVPGLASAGAGMAARAGAGKLTNMKVDRLQRSVATGLPPTGQQLLPSPDEIMRLMLATQGGSVSANAPVR